MSKEIPSFETDELLQNTVEADASYLEAMAETEAMKALEDKRMLGNYVTPFGVKLAENVELTEVKIDMASATNTVSYTSTSDGRDYQHDRD